MGKIDMDVLNDWIKIVSLIKDLFSETISRDDLNDLRTRTKNVKKIIYNLMSKRVIKTGDNPSTASIHALEELVFNIHQCVHYDTTYNHHSRYFTDGGRSYRFPVTRKKPFTG